MLRKVSILLVVATLILTLTSCQFYERFNLDENLHNKISENFNETDTPYIVYENERYVPSEYFQIYSMDTFKSNNDILISWNGMRIGYITMYYSYTSETPMFIYDTRRYDVYLSENYDYMSDAFVIQNTEDEIVFSNIFGDLSEKDKKLFDNSKNIKLHSKEHERISVELQVEFLQGEWYCSFLHLDKVWKCSTTLVELLNSSDYS